MRHLLRRELARTPDMLAAHIVRLGAPDAPMPYNDELERAAISSQDRIAQAVRDLF